MASVIRLVEIGFGRRRASWSDRYVHEYVRAFRATTNDPTMDPEQVRAGAEALGLPQRWDSHPSDPQILVKEVDVEEQPDAYRWVFTVRYSSEASDPSRQAFNPLDEPPVATFAQEDWEEALQADAGDNPIVNTVGDFYDPPPTARRSRVVMTLVQNQASYDQVQAAQYSNKLNLGVFLGAAEG